MPSALTLCVSRGFGVMASSSSLAARPSIVAAVAGSRSERLLECSGGGDASAAATVVAPWPPRATVTVIVARVTSLLVIGAGLHTSAGCLRTMSARGRCRSAHGDEPMRGGVNGLEKIAYDSAGRWANPIGQRIRA
jgi:hypothetical protein